MSHMEEDEDDLYGENGSSQQPQSSHPPQNEDEDDDQEEEMDEDDSDSDDSIEIVTERKEGDAPAVVPGQATSRTDALGQASAAIPIVAPASQTAIPAAKVEYNSIGRAQVTVQSGLAYPEVRSSTMDVNGNPIYPPIGKPITEIEIDADLVEHEKPWRRPGADQSDYFNYGFDEFTWSTYTLRQKTMGGAISEQKNENVQFDMMFGGGGGMMGPGMGMPDMSSMGGMAGMPDMQAVMMETMRQTGETDPSKVDFNAFMNNFQGPGGNMMGQQNAPSGPSQQQQNYGGGNNWHGGGGGGGNFRGNKRGRQWQ